MKNLLKLSVALCLLLPSLGVSATVEERLDALTAEIANLKEEMSVPNKAEKSFGGLGTGASKVYFSKSPLSIGGYGEIVYQNVQGSTSDTTDMLRLVPYFGYRFNDWLVFNSEIEFEHGDEIFVEFAYLDFLLSEGLNVRVGHVLVPVGITNLMHEPTLFPSVNRSEVERNIIPTTWHENGVLLHGDLGDFSYQAGLVSSLDATGFAASSWLRNGREKGSQAKANQWSMVARLDWEGVEGLMLGGSFFTGKSSHGTSGLGDATVSLWELHALYQWRGLVVKALYTMGTLDDSVAVSTTNSAVVGEEAQGYYVEAQYNIMPFIKPTSDKAFNIFARYDDYDPQSKVDSTQTADASLHKKITTVGVNYLPVSNVILKADYQFRETEAGEENDLWELGVGWVF